MSQENQSARAPERDDKINVFIADLAKHIDDGNGVPEEDLYDGVREIDGPHENGTTIDDGSLFSFVEGSYRYLVTMTAEHL
jgi:hypothetical protein